VAAAKAYLGRSKFSAATKKKIAACINRKAKQLGCKVSKKAKANVETFPMYRDLNTEEKQIYSSEIFNETKELVEQSIKNPDMELYPEEDDCNCGDKNQ
jgi:ribosomal protein L4